MPADNRGQGRKKAERNANIVKILLKLINKTLVATGKIGRYARMNGQKRIFVIGIGRLDLTSKRSRHHQPSFCFQYVSRDRSGDDI